MDCFKKVSEYLAKTGQEVDGKTLKMISDRIEAKIGKGLTQAEFASEIESLVESERGAVAAKVRAQKLINARIIQRNVETVTQKGGPTRQSITVGLFGGGIEAGKNVNLDPKGIYSSYQSKFARIWSIMTKENEVRDYSISGKNKDLILRELQAIQKGTETGLTKDPVALKIAQALDTFNRAIFDSKKAYNAFLEKIDEYFVKTFHDRVKISAMTDSEWIGLALTTFEQPDGMTPREWASQLYDIKKSIEDGYYGTIKDYEHSQSIGRNIVGQQNRERVLIPQSPEALANYMEKAGFNTFDEVVNRVSKQTAKQLAIMDKFGSTPERNWNTTWKMILEKASPEQRKELLSQQRKIFADFANAASISDSPAHAPVGRVLQGARELTANTHLPLSTLSSLGHIGVSSSLIESQITGHNLFGTAMDLVSAMSKHFFSNKETRLQLLQDLSLTSHLIGNDLLAQGDIGKGNGVWKLMNSMGPANFLHRFVDSLRYASAIVTSRNIGAVADLGFKDLKPRLQETLLRYGIEAPEWEVIRRGVEDWSSLHDTGVLPKEVGKLDVLSAASVEQIPLEFVSKYLKDTGQLPEGGVSDEVLSGIRGKLANRFGVLLNDFADMGSAAMNSRQRNFLTAGQSSDSVVGATMRTLTLFKGAAYSQLNSYARILASGGGPRSNIASMGLILPKVLFFAAIGQYTKDAILGKTPQDPRSWKFAGEMLGKSGILGPMADFLVDSFRANGVDDAKLGALQWAIGPVFGDALEATGIAVDALKKEYEGKKIAKGRAFRLLTRELPVNNVIAAKGLLDHYFYNGIQEDLNSGFIGRLESQTRQQGQEYFMLKPSESKRYGK